MMLLSKVPKGPPLSLVALLLLAAQMGSITPPSKPHDVPSVDFVVSNDPGAGPTGPGIPVFQQPEKPQQPQKPQGLAMTLQQCQSQEFIQVCYDSAMNITNADAIGSDVSSPPDPHGAVGPKTLIAVTNRRIECLRKDTGATVFGPAYLKDMFAQFSPFRLFDPRIRYDVHRQRFFVAVLEMVRPIINGTLKIVDSSIMVAVSKTDNPLSATSNDWYMAKIPSAINGSWADYPELAIDEEVVYIGCNLYKMADNYWDKSLLWIIKKEEFYAGNTIVWNRYDYIAAINAAAGNNNAFHDTFVPAMVRAPAGVPNNVGTYMFSYSGWTNYWEWIQIIQISNPLTSPTFRYAAVFLGDIDSADYSYYLPKAPQPGTDLLIETNDQRALDAVWVDNHFWAVFTVKDFAGETAAHWIKLVADGGTTWPPTVADQGQIDGEDISQGTYVSFPSLDVNSKGVAAFGFAASSPTKYAGAYATIRDDVNDQPGATHKANIVREGQAPYYIIFNGTRNRWGDYTSVALDPSNDDCFWAYNQYAGDYNISVGFGSWKTAWAKLCYPAKPWIPRCSKQGSKCLRSSKCCSGTCRNRRCV